MTEQKTLVRVKGRVLKLSNLEKVLYPQAGFTKGQVLDYYHRVSPVLLPHLRNRPLTLKRYPEGVGGDYFYEKRCPPHRPEWVRTKNIPGEKRVVDYCVIDDEPALIWVANLASLELHVLLSTVEHVNRPTVVAFDLDPGEGNDILDCARVALEVRDLLARVKLVCFPKTSGGKGLHLYVPLNTPVTFDDTKTFARAIAREMEKRHSDRVVSTPLKSQRKGKVFIDWSQNDEHKTTVCPYSLRAREEPIVSTPITWDELAGAVRRGKADALVFDSDSVLRRVRNRRDPFASVLTLRQNLPR